MTGNLLGFTPSGKGFYAAHLSKRAPNKSIHVNTLQRLVLTMTRSMRPKAQVQTPFFLAFPPAFVIPGPTPLAGVFNRSHMKQPIRLLLPAVLILLTTAAIAQFGPRGSAGGGGRGFGGPPTPRLDGHLAKLFGSNPNFSANVAMQANAQGEDTELEGLISFAEGKSRFDIDMGKVKNKRMRADAAEQLKAMGMDRMVMISRPDKKTAYIVYPGLEAYVEMSQDQENGAQAKGGESKVDVTELGKETIDGHPCVKNKAVITDESGAKHEAIVWNATDLKNFPVQIQHGEEGQKGTLHFSNIKFEKPAADAFEPPKGVTRYESFPAMMQGAMMKRMGGPGGPGFPGRPPAQ